MVNPIQWVEIPANDLERAKKFYETVLNLQFQYFEIQDTKMYMFGDPSHQGAAGCIVTSPDHKPSTEGILPYFKCSDVAIEESKVKNAGGEVLVSKTDIGENIGYFSLFLDTEGNKIGLHSDPE